MLAICFFLRFESNKGASINSAEVINIDKDENRWKNISKSNKGARINSAHVINLDKDVKRWKSIISKVDTSIQIQRFTAVNGKDVPLSDMHKLGIGWAMIHSGKGPYKDQEKDLRNVGTIGCFLSHRYLLFKLSQMNVSDDYGHLILEDDVELPKRFLMPGDRWHSVKHEIPDDWDMVFLGMTTPRGDRISKNVLKLKNQIVNSGNWGTHAYIVRHKSLNKILSWLKYMIDSIDCQFNMMFNVWNVYCVSPFIILLNDKMARDSSITNM